MKKTNLYLQKNEAVMSDDPYLIEGTKTQEFITFGKYYSYDAALTDRFFSVYLRYDSNYDIFSREVYSIL